MSIDELRAGFERLASTVTPVPDPYQRLIRRQRRHRWTRRGGLLSVAAAVAVLAGALTTQPGGGGNPAPGPDPDTYGLIHGPYAQALLRAPTRGSLAGRPDLIDQLLADVPFGDSFPENRVLFLGDIGGNRLAVVAHFDATQGMIDTFAGPRGESMAALADHQIGHGGQVNPILAFRASDAAPSGQLVLAPPGCEVRTADPATIVGHTTGAAPAWTPSPQGDWLQTVSTPGRLIRVDCDGQVRQQGPVQFTSAFRWSDSSCTAGTVVTPPTLPFAMVCTAYLGLTGDAAISGPAKLYWAGQIPPTTGHAGGPAVVIGGRDGGALTVMVGDLTSCFIEIQVPGPNTPCPKPTDGLIGTGLAAPGGPIAIRLPVPVGRPAAIGDDILILAPPGAATVSVGTTEGSDVSAPVHDGFGIVTVPIGHAASARTLSATGSVLSASGFADPTGPVLFGVQVIDNW